LVYKMLAIPYLYLSTLFLVYKILAILYLYLFTPFLSDFYSDNFFLISNLCHSYFIYDYSVLFLNL
jgi:hypothetical protein